MSAGPKPPVVKLEISVDPPAYLWGSNFPTTPGTASEPHYGRQPRTQKEDPWLPGLLPESDEKTAPSDLKTK